MFTQLLAQHFVHTALWAGAVVAVVSGAIGIFVVTRGMSFAVHAISELGFTGAAGALVVGIDPVIGMIGGSLLVGLVLGLLSLRGRERDSAIGAVLAFGLGVGVLFLSLYQGYATEATNLLFGSIVGVSDAQLRDLAIVGVDRPRRPRGALPAAALLERRSRGRGRARRAAPRALGRDLPPARADDGRGDPGRRRAARADARDHAGRGRPAPDGAARRSRSCSASSIALVSTEGGILLSLAQPWPTSFFISAISFAVYVAARIVDWNRGRQSRLISSPPRRMWAVR